jgi:hypothetical protein
MGLESREFVSHVALTYVRYNMLDGPGAQIKGEYGLCVQVRTPLISASPGLDDTGAVVELQQRCICTGASCVAVSDAICHGHLIQLANRDERVWRDAIKRLEREGLVEILEYSNQYRVPKE